MFQQSSSKFPLSLMLFLKHTQLSAAEQLFRGVSEGVFARFFSVSHKMRATKQNEGGKKKRRKDRQAERKTEGEREGSRFSRTPRDVRI